MNNTHVLIGCIEELEMTIKTRFVYLNRESGEVKDVTLPLYYAIEKYNKVAKETVPGAKYYTYIPYRFNDDLMEYSFGCGLSHYLNKRLFKDIEENSIDFDMEFPLSECELSMYTPSDLRHILDVKHVFDEALFTALKERY